MALNSRKISYLEHLLGSGLPLHKPLHRWSPVALSRLEDPAVLAGLSDEEIARLIEEAEDMVRAEGIDPASLPAADLPMSSTDGVEASAHGREPMAHKCGCGPCGRWRRDRGLPEFLR